jgi:hypothetical protein
VVIPLLAIASLALSAVSKEDSPNDAFQKAWYTNNPEYFWDKIPRDDRHRIFVAIFNRFEENGRLKDFERMITLDIFREFTFESYGMPLRIFAAAYLEQGFDILPDRYYQLDEAAFVTQLVALRDCKRFVDSFWEDRKETLPEVLQEALVPGESTPSDKQIARAFWLARAHFVSNGFLDSSIYKPSVAEILVAQAQKFPKIVLFEGSDHKFYSRVDSPEEEP